MKTGMTIKIQGISDSPRAGAIWVAGSQERKADGNQEIFPLCLLSPFCSAHLLNSFFLVQTTCLLFSSPHGRITTASNSQVCISPITDRRARPTGTSHFTSTCPRKDLAGPGWGGSSPAAPCGFWGGGQFPQYMGSVAEEHTVAVQP